MNDRAEQAFRDAFAEQARVPLGRVRPQPPPRRRTRWVAAAAVAAVGVGVPVAVLLDGGGLQVAGPSAPTTVSGLPAPEEGWRWVSRAEVAVQVPAEWGYSDYAWVPWCLGGTTEPERPAEPFVSTPAGPVAAIACPEWRPEWVQTYVEFADPATEPSSLTPVVRRTVGGTDVRVVLSADATADDEAVAQRILDSATAFERDAAGCTAVAPFADLEARPEAWDVTRASDVVEVGVCRYLDFALEAERPNLIASRVIAGDEAQALVAAVAAAPEGVSGRPEDCLSDYDQRSGVALRVLDSSGIHDLYLRADGCRNLGFDDGTTHRELTRDACAPVFAADPVRFDGGQPEAVAACHSEG